MWNFCKFWVLSGYAQTNGIKGISGISHPKTAHMTQLKGETQGLKRTERGRRGKRRGGGRGLGAGFVVAVVARPPFPAALERLEPAITTTSIAALLLLRSPASALRYALPPPPLPRRAPFRPASRPPLHFPRVSAAALFFLPLAFSPFRVSRFSFPSPSPVLRVWTVRVCPRCPLT